MVGSNGCSMFERVFGLGAGVRGSNRCSAGRTGVRGRVVHRVWKTVPVGRPSGVGSPGGSVSVRSRRGVFGVCGAVGVGGGCPQGVDFGVIHSLWIARLGGGARGGRVEGVGFGARFGTRWLGARWLGTRRRLGRSIGLGARLGGSIGPIGPVGFGGSGSVGRSVLGGRSGVDRVDRVGHAPRTPDTGRRPPVGGSGAEPAPRHGRTPRGGRGVRSGGVGGLVGVGGPRGAGSGFTGAGRDGPQPNRGTQPRP